MALYDPNEDFGDEKPRSGPQNVTGYVFSMMLVGVIVIIALALLYAVAQPSTHLAGRGPRNRGRLSRRSDSQPATRGTLRIAAGPQPGSVTVGSNVVASLF
jgi:hypothetical protein